MSDLEHMNLALSAAPPLWRDGDPPRRDEVAPGQDRAGAFGQGGHRLLVVADGAASGMHRGRRHGSKAAQRVVDGVGRAAAAADRPLRTVGLRRLLERLDRQLWASRRPWQSTAVVVEVVGQAIFGASVGDSGAWLVSGERHLDLTAGQQRKGRLGGGLAVPVTFGPLPLVGTLLLATDGLFDFAIPEWVEDAMRPNGVEARRAEPLTAGPVSDRARPLSSVAADLVRRVRTPKGDLREDLAILLCRHRPRAAARATLGEVATVPSG